MFSFDSGNLIEKKIHQGSKYTGTNRNGVLVPEILKNIISGHEVNQTHYYSSGKNINVSLPVLYIEVCRKPFNSSDYKFNDITSIIE